MWISTSFNSICKSRFKLINNHDVICKIEINIWRKRKNGNVKKRNVPHGKVENVSAIVNKWIVECQNSYKDKNRWIINKNF